MFNVEPQEKWTAEEIDEFERHVAARHRRTLKDAAWAGFVLLLTFLCITAPSYDHALLGYWERMKPFILLAWLGSLIWFVYKAGLVWASWQAARDTRREFGDSD